MNQANAPYEAELQRAFAAQDEGNPGQAQDTLDRLAAAYPDVARIQAARGALLQARGAAAAAIEAYERALVQDPGHAGALTNLGILTAEAGDSGGAVRLLRRAIAANPCAPEPHLNLGTVLERARRPAEAIEAFRAALALAPDNAVAWHNLGTAFHAAGRLDEAVAAFESALRLDPALHDARWNLSHSLLMAGDYRRGFAAFEARWDTTALAGHRRHYAQPLLGPGTIGAVAGKTVFVHAEQGFGDTFQFARFLIDLKRHGARVVLHVQPPLLRLFDGFSGADEIAPWNAPAPERFDFHLPLLTLPHALGVADAALLWPGTPYLAAPAALAADWRQRFNATATHRVGLVWATGVRRFDATLIETGIVRNVPLALLKPLSGVQGVALFSLQKGEGEAEIGSAGVPMTDWTAGFTDFADTAAMIAQLDLVITVDTGLAHLAGAMGKPVWLMLRHEGEWRWHAGGERSHWYPSMRIFRQQTPGDWRAPIAAIVQALHELPAPAR
jgi:tetratricopeptide (TPR) repeat protein